MKQDLLTKNWWRAEEGEVHKRIYGSLQDLYASISRRDQYYSVTMRLYDTGRADDSFATYLWGNDDIFIDMIANTSQNICRSVIEASLSMICSNESRALFLADGGDFTSHSNAKKLDSIAWGVQHSNDWWSKAYRAMLQAFVVGNGFLKTRFEDDKICIEQVPAHQMIVDTRGLNPGDSPRRLYQRSFVDPECLIDMLDDMDLMTPEKYEAIINAIDKSPALAPGILVRGAVPVLEGWSLSPDGGRHIMCVEDCDLFDEPCEYHPFLIITAYPAQRSWYGLGLMSHLMPGQILFNDLLQRISDNIRFHSHATTLVENDSVDSVVANALGSVVNYTRTPPQLYAPNSVSPQVIDHARWIKELMADLIGMSDASVFGVKSSDRTSGTARQYVVDLEARRFLNAGKAWQQLAVQQADLTLRTLQDNATSSTKIKFPGKGPRAFDMIDWGDVKFERDNFIIKSYDIPILPALPAARLERLETLTAAQMITPAEAKYYMGNLDTQDMDRRNTAQADLADKQIEAILEKGDLVTPDPMQDLDVCLERANSSFALAQLQGIYPNAHIDALVNYIMNTEDLINQKKQDAQQQAMQAQAMQQPAMPESPGEPGMPPEPQGMPGLPPIQ